MNRKAITSVHAVYIEQYCTNSYTTIITLVGKEGSVERKILVNLSRQTAEVIKFIRTCTTPSCLGALSAPNLHPHSISNLQRTCATMPTQQTTVLSLAYSFKAHTGSTHIRSAHDAKLAVYKAGLTGKMGQVQQQTVLKGACLLTCLHGNMVCSRHAQPPATRPSLECHQYTQFGLRNVTQRPNCFAKYTVTLG